VSTVSERMQELVSEYVQNGGAWPATARQIAEWAVKVRNRVPPQDGTDRGHG